MAAGDPSRETKRSAAVPHTGQRSSDRSPLRTYPQTGHFHRPPLGFDVVSLSESWTPSFPGWAEAPLLALSEEVNRFPGVPQTGHFDGARVPFSENPQTGQFQAILLYLLIKTIRYT